MLRTNQNVSSQILKRFVTRQRNYAAKSRQSKKAQIQLPPDNSNGLDVPVEETINAHFLKREIG